MAIFTSLSPGPADLLTPQIVQPTKNPRLHLEDEGIFSLAVPPPFVALLTHCDLGRFAGRSCKAGTQTIAR